MSEYAWFGHTVNENKQKALKTLFTLHLFIEREMKAFGCKNLFAKAVGDSVICHTLHKTPTDVYPVFTWTAQVLYIWHLYHNYIHVTHHKPFHVFLSSASSNFHSL